MNQRKVFANSAILLILVWFFYSCKSNDNSRIRAVVFLSNLSEIDSCITFKVNIGKSSSALIKVAKSDYPSTWDSVVFETNDNDSLFAVGIQETNFQIDTVIELRARTNIFCYYKKEPSYYRYANPEVYRIIAESGDTIQHYRPYVDSLYENGIIVYEPTYEESLSIKVQYLQ